MKTVKITNLRKVDSQEYLIDVSRKFMMCTTVREDASEYDFFFAFLHILYGRIFHKTKFRKAFLITMEPEVKNG